MTASRPLVALVLALAFSLPGCVFRGGTPLARASAAGDVSTMTALLDQGADPNDSGGFGLTPLASAARTGKMEAIELLLKRGADPHRGSGVNGWTPLLHALHKDQIAAALRLAQTCNAPSQELDEALYMAAGYAQTDAATFLLQRGADPRRTHGDGSNALSNGAAGAFDIDYSYRGCEPHAATVRALLAAYPDLKLAGDQGRAARRSVARRGCPELLALLEGR